MTDVFGLSTVDSAYITLAMFAGGIIGSLMAILFADKVGLFECFSLSLVIHITLFLYLTVEYWNFDRDADTDAYTKSGRDHDLILPIIVISLFFLCYEISFVVLILIWQQSHFADPMIFTTSNLFSLDFGFWGVGKMCGIYTTAYLWNNARGLARLAIASLVLSTICLVLTFILYKVVEQTKNYNQSMNGTVTTNDGKGKGKHEMKMIEILS
jgi:hypothetical protein